MSSISCSRKTRCTRSKRLGIIEKRKCSGDLLRRPIHAYGFTKVTAVATAAKAIAAAVATPAIVKASLAFTCASLAKSKAAFASVLALRAASSSSAFAAFLRSSFLSSR